MTRGPAEEYWARTAEACFESMASTYQPGERAQAETPPKPARRGLPPLTASQTIVDAIAACAPPNRTSATPSRSVQAIRRLKASVTAD